MEPVDTSFSFKDIIQYLCGAFMVVVGWDVNRLNQHKEEHAILKEHVDRNCVTREELRDFINRTDDMLDRIFEKLDDKLDK